MPTHLRQCPINRSEYHSPHTAARGKCARSLAFALLLEAFPGEVVSVPEFEEAILKRYDVRARRRMDTGSHKYKSVRPQAILVSTCALSFRRTIRIRRAGAGTRDER